MVFTTPFSRNKLSSLRRWCGLFVLWMALSAGLSAAWADNGGIKAQQTSSTWGDNQVEISANYKISLAPALEDALLNGLSLPFVYEFQLTRPRMYSWYRQVADWFSPTATLTYRLSYHALSRQYRLHLGSFYRSFNTLDEALSALGVIRGWAVLQDTSIAQDKSDFSGRMRLKLDVSQLPKTWQLTALGQSDWQLESSWSEVGLRSDEDGK